LPGQDDPTTLRFGGGPDLFAVIRNHDHGQFIPEATEKLMDHFGPELIGGQDRERVQDS
jgi:hypothetical protein